MTGDPIFPDEPVAPPPPPLSPPPPRRSGTPILIAAIVAFAVGIALVILALPLIDRWRDPQPAAQAQPAAAAVQPVAAATLDSLATREAALDAQLRAVEARLAIAEGAARTAASDATRAERLLIAVAARRELNRGLPLGYLETQLRNRFSDQPRAIAQVIAASRQPVTLEDLRQALDTMAPQLATGTASEGLWPAIRRELTGLVVIRKESAPSPRPSDRLVRARRMVDAGNVEGAMAEVSLMPGADGAKSWTDAAGRYVAARRALNILEMAALDAPAPRPAQPVAVPPAAN